MECKLVGFSQGTNGFSKASSVFTKVNSRVASGIPSHSRGKAVPHLGSALTVKFPQRHTPWNSYKWAWLGPHSILFGKSKAFYDAMNHVLYLL